MIDFTEYLNRHNTFAEVSNQQKLDESHAINTVLVKFGVHVTRVIESPRFLQYRVQLTPDCNVDKMLKLRENLCIALNDDSVNLYREKAELVIEKRGENNTIMLGDLYTDYFKSKDGLTIMLGKDLQGVNVYTNLAKAPHILIAGTTGSGKSICYTPPSALY
jgi:S-DNA-T family DNA segregation ATPase FtsK/SpoIIIE